MQRRILDKVRAPYETNIQEKMIAKIKKRFGDGVWVFKSHDQCRVGVPDLILCFFGHFVAIEIKRAPSKAEVNKHNEKSLPRPRRQGYGERPMQTYNIMMINNSGGTAFSAWDTVYVMEKLERIKNSLEVL